VYNNFHKKLNVNCQFSSLISIPAVVGQINCYGFHICCKNTYWQNVN